MENQSTSATDVPSFPQPEPHAFLKRFVGRWAGESDVHPDSGDATVELRGGAVFKEVGSWVMGEGTVPIEGVTLTTIFTLGHEPHRGKFVATWIDSIFSFLRTYEGELDESGEVLTLECDVQSLEDPEGRVHFREVISFVEDDRTLHETFMSTDGDTWTQTVSARSRRVGDA